MNPTITQRISNGYDFGESVEANWIVTLEALSVRWLMREV